MTAWSEDSWLGHAYIWLWVLEFYFSRFSRTASHVKTHAVLFIRQDAWAPDKQKKWIDGSDGGHILDTVQMNRFLWMFVRRQLEEIRHVLWSLSTTFVNQFSLTTATRCRKRRGSKPWQAVAFFGGCFSGSQAAGYVWHTIRQWAFLWLTWIAGLLLSNIFCFSHLDVVVC